MSQKESLSQSPPYSLLWEVRANGHSIHGHIRMLTWTHRGHEDISCIYTLALTKRDEGVLDCIALDDITQYAVHTLNDVSVESLHIAQSTNCHSVLCITLHWVPYTREGSAKELTTPQCPIVYPQWGWQNITVPTDESELVWTVSLDLQGDIEDSCEASTTRHIWE